MKQDYKHLSKFLRDARIKADISQNELGSILGYHGQFISNWERGDSTPPPKILRKLCDAIKIPHKDLLKVIMKEQEIFWSSHLGRKTAEKR